MPHLTVIKGLENAPKTANEVLRDFFDGVQWATSLFEVKMLAAQAFEEVTSLMK